MSTMTASEVRNGNFELGTGRAKLVDFAIGTYAAGGLAVDPHSFGMNSLLACLQVGGNAGAGAYRFNYDTVNKKLLAFRSAGIAPGASLGTPGMVNDDDAAATKGHALYVVRQSGGEVSTVIAEASATGLIIDSDTAATEGVLIYVVIDDPEYLPGFQLAHLEFVSPTNAHGTCTVFDGGPTLLIEDDDAAATNGVVVRAIAASGGLEATLASTGLTALVPLSDGQFLHIADSTTGSTPSIYFDEDAANTFDRLRAVIVDNANEPYKLGEASPSVARPAEFSSSRLASLVTVAPGDSVSQGTVGTASGGPEFDVIHDQAAAQIVGATPLYVQAAGAGFNAALPGGEDVYIPLANGEFIKVAYAASPAGVLVYWDHDGTNSWERMLSVVVDNLDETFSTIAPAMAEVSGAVDLSAITVRLLGIGF